MKQMHQKMCIENTQQKSWDAKHIFQVYSPLLMPMSFLMNLGNKSVCLYVIYTHSQFKLLVLIV